MLKNLLIIFSMFLLLQGCAAVVVGGAGAGGYYAGKDKRKFGTIMEDAAITARINSKLITAKGVSTFDIDVDTYNSVVTLSGHVPSRTIKRTVIWLSKKVDGVRKVISKLRIKK